MIKILAFDPGGTTGWAVVEYDEKESKLIEYGQITGGYKGFKDFYLNSGIDADVVVCESFTLRSGMPSVNLEPCYVIGVLYALENKPVIFYPPSYKIFCNDDALKRLEFYVKGKQHARDAIRHAVAYLRLEINHIPTMKKGWPDE
jgi:hypothetical protein